MLNRDFFAFCTSLKPLELKALGALSRARHIPSGQTIYCAGDKSDALYIISRGMVEIVQENASRTAPGTYLSRGDIFGDVEVLTDLPREHLVRTCAEVSLQAVHRRDFPEMLRRVPSFFRYLSEQLASRLLQARDVALSRSHCLELSGSLSNFDLVTVYQTITHSSQTGRLSILDEQGNSIATFFFESGQPRSGQFQHLSGEEAFTQLFLADDLAGTFAFSSGDVAPSGTEAARIGLKAEKMLITALQARDEFNALRAELPNASTTIECLRREPRLERDAPEQLTPLAQQIRQLLEQGPLGFDRLYLRLGVSELKIYAAVAELLRADHVTTSPSPSARKVA